MKKLLALVISLIIAIGAFATPAFALTLSMNGEVTDKKVDSKPLVLPDPRAVKVARERDDLIENDENEDKGTVWVSWSGVGKSFYGCTTAMINYTNPTRSNIGVTVAVAIPDDKLVKYFGTTFRSEKEVNELMEAGFAVLQDDTLVDAQFAFLDIGMPFDRGNGPEIYILTREELCETLAKAGFMGMTANELMEITLEDIYKMDEIQKLQFAQLGGYNFYDFYCSIGEAGLVNPGYKLPEIDLHTLPGGNVLPKGMYECIYVLNGFDESKNEFSDFYIKLPVDITIKEDLPEDMQKEYNVKLLQRID